jgi:hypothetical protein
MAPSESQGGTGGMGDAVTVLESPEPRPAPSGSDDPGASGPDAGTPLGDGPLGGELAEGSPEPIGADVAVAGCTITETSCVRLFISVADADAETCLQLSLDDCNDTTRPGLAVDVPLSWRFSSAFVGLLDGECVPNTQFQAMTDTAIVGGTGSISWNRDSRRPSEIVIDVTLQPSLVAVDSDPIRVSNGDLVGPIPECEG